MAHLIDKDALVAEIERRIKKYATIDVGNSSELDALYGAKCHALKSILTFLDTLEVKEVNLEKEIGKYLDANDIEFGHQIKLFDIAKYFFELGTKVSNKTKKDVSYVKIDRKVLFEMCDAILNHDGYADRDDCPENDFPYFVGWWDIDFRKKVENIRNNS